jgi:hypothetical protein
VVEGETVSQEVVDSCAMVTCRDENRLDTNG